MLTSELTVVEGLKTPLGGVRKWNKSPRTSKKTRASKTLLKPKKKKKPTRTKLIKEADRLASLYVRHKYADKDGMVKCFTCDHIAPIKKMQNGHWVVRQYKYVRWHPDNMRPQCYACNILYNGRPHIFRENLVKEIGQRRVQALEVRAKTLFKEKDEWIENKVVLYQRLVCETQNGTN